MSTTPEEIVATWFYSITSRSLSTSRQPIECLVMNPLSETESSLTRDAADAFPIAIESSHKTQKSLLDIVMSQRQKFLTETTEKHPLEHVKWRIQYVQEELFRYLKTIVQNKQSGLSYNQQGSLLREFTEITCQPDTCPGVLVCSPQYTSGDAITVQSGFYVPPDSTGKRSGRRMILMGKVSQIFINEALYFLNNYFDPVKEGDPPITLHSMQVSMLNIFRRCKETKGIANDFVCVKYVDVSNKTMKSMNHLLGCSKWFEYTRSTALLDGVVNPDTVTQG